MPLRRRNSLPARAKSLARDIYRRVKSGTLRSRGSTDSLSNENLDPVIVHMISLDFIPCVCPGIECVCGKLDRFLTIIEKYRENHPGMGNDDDDSSCFSRAGIWPDDESALSCQHIEYEPFGKDTIDVFDQTRQKIVGEIEINKASSVHASYSTTSTLVLKNWEARLPNDYDHEDIHPVSCGDQAQSKIYDTSDEITPFPLNSDVTINNRDTDSSSNDSSSDDYGSEMEALPAESFTDGENIIIL